MNDRRFESEPSLEGRTFQWVETENTSRRRRGLALKRLLDIVLSAILLIILFPLLVLIGLAVKLSSAGSVLYRWQVMGMGGVPFIGYKFRSMYRDADQRKAELLRDNEMTGPVFKMTNDPRITGVGRILRKYSLDELPQLWNVLKGDMSLVGPRPPLQSEYAHFSEWQKRKLMIKPGLTCLWQVSGRNQIKDFDEWIRLDLQYIAQWSLALDLLIIIRTIPVVIFGRGK
jgi:lipopolysaccharide/colanic/teichoic acid biosynthesis glycosyltransferase